MKTSFAQASHRDARKRTKTQFIRQLFVKRFSGRHVFLGLAGAIQRTARTISLVSDDDL